MSHWARRNGLPTIPHKEVLDFGLQLWQQHTQHITKHITKPSITNLQTQFEGAVFHCEANTLPHSESIVLACTSKAIESTFTDPSVFESIPESPSTLLESLNTQLTHKHGKSYPWALGKGRQLPSGYILPKRKKEYHSGRPIISFVDAPFRPLLNILAWMLFQLIPVACPNHFATGDVYELLSILRSAPTDGDLTLFNQDLAGFFTSIDQDRFIGAWYMLLDFLQPHMNVADNEAFSVYPSKSNNPRPY